MEDKEQVYTFSVKRIKKKINDFILNNYTDLFFHAPVAPAQSEISKMDVDTSEASPDLKPQ